MARTYKRDSRGRFAGGGGGGGGGGKKSAAPKSKAGQTRAANAATDKRLLGAGLRGVGNRLEKKTASLYAGTKATKSRNAKMWNITEQAKNPYGKRGNARQFFSKAKPASTVSRKR